MSGVSGRRAFVAFAARRERSASRACELVKVSRRRLGYVSRKKDEELTMKLKELAAAHPRYGCRRLREMLRRDGRGVNPKRVRRLCREHGLLLKQRRRRKRRGVGIGVPCLAEHPNHVWAYDFVEDRTETGRKLRVLTVADEFTRECVTLETFHNRDHARAPIRLFGRRYNETRPHSSLGYQTPLEFAAAWRTKHEAGTFPAMVR